MSYEVTIGGAGAAVLGVLGFIPVAAAVAAAVGAGAALYYVGKGAIYLGSLAAEKIREAAAEAEKRAAEERRKKFEKLKAEEPAWISITKKEVENNAKKLIEELERTKKEFESVLEKAKEKVEILGESHSLTEEEREIKENIEEINRRIQEINDRKAEILENLNRYDEHIRGATNYEEIMRMSRPKTSFGSTGKKLNVEKLKNRVEERLRTLHEMANIVNKFAEEMRGLHRDEIVERVRETIKRIDIADESSISIINDLINSIKQEIELLKKKTELGNLDASARSEAMKEMLALQNVLNKLNPIQASLISYNEMKANILEENEKAIEKAEELLHEIEEKEFLSDVDKRKLLNLKSELDAVNRNLSSGLSSSRLDRIISFLEELLKEATEEEERHKRFEAALEAYRKFYMGLSEEQLNIVNDTGKRLEHPNYYRYRPHDPRMDNIAEELENLTAHLNAVALERVRYELLEFYAKVFGDRVFAKIMEDGKYELLFVSEKDKGIIYHLVIDEEGNVSIRSKGVVLNNGKAVISLEELKKRHKVCDWSKEIEDFLNESKLCERFKLSHTDIGEAEYSYEEYYHFTSEDESIRYLRKVGFTDEQIREFGYKVGKSSSSNKAREDYPIEIDKAKEAK